MKARMLLSLLLLTLLGAPAWAGDKRCGNRLGRLVRNPLPTRDLRFEFKGLEVASIEDATNSTGATLFYFPKGAHVAVDERGGSVGASDLSLLKEGSYSNEVPAIVFAGGSLMGEAAGMGVKEAIFRSKGLEGSAFDAIEAVPTAVVYDFGGRTAPGNDSLVYPTAFMGSELMQRKGNVFKVGRAGAGVTTTANKMKLDGGTFWGGQAAVIKETPYGKVFAAVVLNPLGNVPMGDSRADRLLADPLLAGLNAQQGKNTTLSLIVLESPMDRNQLQRMSVQVHTNMAAKIQPFHTYWDGDINFAATTGGDHRVLDTEQEFELANIAIAAMKEAIELSVRTSNDAVFSAHRPVARLIARTDEASAALPDSLRVSAVQYPIQNGLSRDELLQKVEGYVREAKAEGSELVVLPELFVYDLVRPGREAFDFRNVALFDTPLIFDHIIRLASELNISILAGSSPRTSERGIVNTALLAFPDGRTVLQDKVFLTPEEKGYGWVAGDEIKVFDAPWGRTSLLICYDCEMPRISHELAAYAPEVILVPSMTGHKGLQRVLSSAKTRAIEHHSFVVATGTIHQGTTSRASFYTPEDQGWPGTLLQGELDREGLVSATLDLRGLRDSRRTTGFWPGRDQSGASAPSGPIVSPPEAPSDLPPPAVPSPPSAPPAEP